MDKKSKAAALGPRPPGREASRSSATPPPEESMAVKASAKTTQANTLRGETELQADDWISRQLPTFD